MLITRPGTCDPRRTSINFFGDIAVVNGVERYSKKHENGIRQYEHNGLKFETKTEVMTARLLVKQGISFLHHVRFPFSTPVAGANVWSPDFLFEDPRLVPVNGGRLTRHLLIHGLEIKGDHTDDGFLFKKRQLVDDHNVHILVLLASELAEYFNNGALPFERYSPLESQPFDPPITIGENGYVGRVPTF